MTTTKTKTTKRSTKAPDYGGLDIGLIGIQTAKQKRLAVRVAKDVLASIKLLDIQWGSYMTLNEIPTALVDKARTSKAQAKLLKTGNCRVCALGACMISLVALENDYQFTFSPEYDDDYNMASTSTIAVYYTGITNRLLQAFPPEQQWLIEDAFEMANMHGYIGGWTPRAIRFGEQYDTPRKRLRAIMKNIIRNGGTFIPTVVKG